MATVAELKQKIMSLEGQKKAFLEDISQLTSGCQLVVDENRLLRTRLRVLRGRRQGKVRSATWGAAGHVGSMSIGNAGAA